MAQARPRCSEDKAEHSEMSLTAEHGRLQQTMGRFSKVDEVLRRQEERKVHHSMVLLLMWPHWNPQISGCWVTKFIYSEKEASDSKMMRINSMINMAPFPKKGK